MKNSPSKRVKTDTELAYFQFDETFRLYKSLLHRKWHLRWYLGFVLGLGTHYVATFMSLHRTGIMSPFYMSYDKEYFEQTEDAPMVWKLVEKNEQ